MMQQTVKIRRSLTPLGTPIDRERGLHAMRRTSGARRETTERVTLIGSESTLEGWSLNVSRGGVRVILEHKVELGAEFAVQLGEDEVGQRGRVVWVQEEPDGMVVGIEYVDASGLSRSAAPPMMHADGDELTGTRKVDREDPNRDDENK